MIEQTVDIPTPAGAASTFISHPERDGPHPLVIVFMDAPGMREELRDMVRRLASVGYYVMLPNLYYRSGVQELPHLGALPPGKARDEVFELESTLTMATVMEDAEALLDYADRDPAASPGRAGCIGYCMSGQYAVNFAARHPERIAAAASVYGVKLVTDRDDSPHLMLHKASAEFYFACAEHDEWAPIEMVSPLEQAAKAYAPGTEIEIYSGAHHGFAFRERPVYDAAAAERHWERLFSLFRRRLQSATPSAAVQAAEIEL